MRKRILFIGNADSIWTKEYIENVLLKEKHEVFLLVNGAVRCEFYDFYLREGIHLIDLANSKFIRSKLGKFLKGIKFYTTIRKYTKNEKMDAIHIFGMPNTMQIFFLEKCIIPRGEKTVCTYLGSELLASDPSKIKRSYGCLKKASHIVLSTSEMRGRFISIFGHEFDQKFSNCIIGTPGLAMIEKVSQGLGKTECKKFWNIGNGELAVAIGYNGAIRQQHIQVIRALKKMDPRHLQNVVFVFQVGYGGDDEQRKEYISIIKREIAEVTDRYIIIEDFLDLSRSAKLRLAIDIFIHAQTTDAFSASIREYLYAGAILINPAWINYSEYRKNNVSYFEYSTFEQLNDLLDEIIANFEQYKKKVQGNRECIGKKYSWETVEKEWNNLYID